MAIPSTGASVGLAVLGFLTGQSRSNRNGGAIRIEFYPKEGMGLTHYWHRSTELPAEAFARASTDCRRAVLATGIPLAGFDGSGLPLFQQDHIMFNGESGGQLEPFEIRQTEFDQRGRNSHWTSGKTGNALYAICVKTALIVLKHHLGDSIRVASDAKTEEWDGARQICHCVLGFGLGFEL